MADWGGILAGALGGTGQGIAYVGKQGMEKADALDLKKELLAMEEEKAVRAEERQRAAHKADTLWATDPTQAGGQAALAARREAGKIETEQAIAKAEGIGPVEVKTATDKHAGILGADLKALKAKGNDPDALKAEKALARAKHIPNEAVAFQREKDTKLEQAGAKLGNLIEQDKADPGKLAGQIASARVAFTAAGGDPRKFDNQMDHSTAAQLAAQYGKMAEAIDATEDEKKVYRANQLKLLKLATGGKGVDVSPEVASPPPRESLVKGQTYALPNGRKAEWTGTGFLVK